MNSYSLKDRLTLSSLIVFFLAWLAMVFIVIVSSFEDDYEELDHALNEAADTLELELANILSNRSDWALFDSASEESRRELAKTIDEVVRKELNGFDQWSDIQVWRGELLIYSWRETLPRYQPLTDGIASWLPKSADPDSHLQLYHRKMDEYKSDLLMWINRDAEEYHGEDEGYIGDLLGILFPLLIVFPITSLILSWVIGRVLKPIFQLKSDITQRNPGNLSAISTDKLPSELHPVIAETNELFYRLQVMLSKQANALEKERNFTANAAHELLTPLAAIKSEVQLCTRQAESYDQSNNKPIQLIEALSEIVSRVDRATHTIEQLVTLARLDPEQPRETKFQKVNLSLLMQETLANLGERIEQKQIDFSFSAPESVVVFGLPTPLSVLCRNLMDNAIKYCPLDGKISCTLFDDNDTILLSVENDGRALPQYLLEHIFDPFVRGPGETESGSGLGLSIVNQVAQIHHAEVNFSMMNDRPGVTVKVKFPVNMPRLND